MKVLTTVAALAILCAMLPAADDPVQTASDNLRAAVEGKKGAADIKRLAVIALTESKKEMGPAPAGADKENWDAHVKYAEGVSEYAEYALISAAAGASPATAADLISTLESHRPNSKYLTQDVYVNAAIGAFTSEPDRAAALARKALTAPKAANSEQAAGRAHYIIGMVAANKNEFAVADKELRAALPGIKGIPSLEGPAYYFLGSADYRLGRQSMDRAQIDQGIKFTTQSALISGQYQSAAASALKTMKAEMGEH